MVLNFLRFIFIPGKRTSAFSFFAITACFALSACLDQGNSHCFQGDEPLGDTVRVRELMDLGRSLQCSAPDSALAYFDQAIQILDNLPQKEEVQKRLAACYIRQASIHNYSGEYAQSASCDSSAMAIGLALGDKGILAQAANIEGLLHFNQSDYPAALQKYEQALALAKEAANRRVEAMIYTNTAIIYFYQGDFEEAGNYFSKTIDMAIVMQDSILLSGSYINRGMIAQHAGDMDAAIDYYGKAEEMCRLIKDENGVILCNQNIGSLYYNNGQLLKALDAFNESLRIAKMQHDRSNMAKGYHNLGEIYASLGDYQTAFDYYIQSANIKEQLNDLQGLASSYISLGSLDYQQGNYDESLENYLQSLKINEELNYQKGIAKAYSNLANVYRQKGAWESGIDYALKSLTIHEQIHFEEDLDNLYLIIGSLYSGKGDFVESERYLKMALDRGMESGDTLEMASAMNELSGMMLKKAKTLPKEQQKVLYVEGIHFGESVLRLLKNKHALITQNETLSVLKDAYAKSGNLRKALWASEESKQICDSLLDQQKSKYLILAEAKWKAEQSKSKIAELEKAELEKDLLIQKKDSENKLKNTIIYLLVLIGVMLIMVLLFLVVFIRKKREELYQKQVQQVTSLRMKNIRNRVSSHFFFNVLSLVSSYDPEGMKQILRNLALLFRKSVENIDQLAVSIEEELSLVKAYVDLQRLRMSDQFQVQILVANDVDLQTQIPAMLIQIPVENAIKHGLMPLAGAQKLGISISKHDEQVHIQITDNGIGFKKSAGRSTGTGTGLKVLYEVISLMNKRNENEITICIDEEGLAPEYTTGAMVRFSVPVNYQFEKQKV